MRWVSSGQRPIPDILQSASRAFGKINGILINLYKSEIAHRKGRSRYYYYPPRGGQAVVTGQMKRGELPPSTNLVVDPRTYLLENGVRAKRAIAMTMRVDTPEGFAGRAPATPGHHRPSPAFSPLIACCGGHCFPEIPVVVSPVSQARGHM